MLPQTLTLLLLELILTHKHRSHEFPHWGLDGYIELAGVCAKEKKQNSQNEPYAEPYADNLALFPKEQHNWVKLLIFLEMFWPVCHAHYKDQYQTYVHIKGGATIGRTHHNWKLAAWVESQKSMPITTLMVSPGARDSASTKERTLSKTSE